MTIRDLIDNSVTLQGDYVIKSLKEDNEECVWYSGDMELYYGAKDLSFLDKDILYIYPSFDYDKQLPIVVIEIEI